MDKQITIRIPQPLAENLEKELKQSPFANLDELLTVIIQYYFEHKNSDSGPQGGGSDEALRKRLEGLGYL